MVKVGRISPCCRAAIKKEYLGKGFLLVFPTVHLQSWKPVFLIVSLLYSQSLLR